RTWMALSARMLARVSLAAGERVGARTQIGKALDVIRNEEVPLAAWRAYATAAEICEHDGDHHEAAPNWKASAETVRQLALSLGAYPGLSQNLPSNPAARTVVAGD